MPFFFLRISQAAKVYWRSAGTRDKGDFLSQSLSACL